VKPPIAIAVCGAGQADPQTASLAEQVGQVLARRGVRLVCGGLGGVMAAACRGAKSAGGMTIGILPGPDPADANTWVDVAIPTGLGNGRNLVIIYTADGVLALPGNSGTLSEIAFGLKIGKPVVDLGGWGIPGMIPAPGGPEQAVQVLLGEISKRKAQS